MTRLKRNENLSFISPCQRLLLGWKVILCTGWCHDGNTVPVSHLGRLNFWRSVGAQSSSQPGKIKLQSIWILGLSNCKPKFTKQLEVQYHCLDQQLQRLVSLYILLIPWLWPNTTFCQGLCSERVYGCRNPVSFQYFASEMPVWRLSAISTSKQIQSGHFQEIAGQTAAASFFVKVPSGLEKVCTRLAQGILVHILGTKHGTSGLLNESQLVCEAVYGRHWFFLKIMCPNNPMVEHGPQFNLPFVL